MWIYSETRRNSARAAACFGLVMALLASHTAFAGEIFKWVDENGVIHFGDRPPEKAKAEPVPLENEPQTSGVGTGETWDVSIPVNEEGKTLAQQRRDEISQSRDATGQDREQIEQACAHHRQELARFEPARRITYTDENGQVVRLDDEQRMLLIDTTRDFIEKYCE